MPIKTRLQLMLCAWLPADVVARPSLLPPAPLPQSSCCCCCCWAYLSMTVLALLSPSLPLSLSHLHLIMGGRSHSLHALSHWPQSLPCHAPRPCWPPHEAVHASMPSRIVISLRSVLSVGAILQHLSGLAMPNNLVSVVVCCLTDDCVTSPHPLPSPDP